MVFERHIKSIDISHYDYTLRNSFVHKWLRDYIIRLIWTRNRSTRCRNGRRVPWIFLLPWKMWGQERFYWSMRWASFFKRRRKWPIYLLDHSSCSFSTGNNSNILQQLHCGKIFREYSDWVYIRRRQTKSSVG